jgi:DNA recombination protein RmuC
VTDIVLLALSALVIGAIAAGGAVWLLNAPKIVALKGENDALRKDAAEARQAREELENIRGKLEAAQGQVAELEPLRERVAQAQASEAAANAKLEAHEKISAEKDRQFLEAREELQRQFKVLASDVLRENKDELLKQAKETFDAQKALSNSEHETRSKEIVSLIKPLEDKLKNYEEHVTAIEAARNKSYGELNRAIEMVQNETKGVRDVTANLVNALKASPKTIGRWGEEQLKRVMEMSQLLEHCDFDTEVTFQNVDETIRPDVVIKLVGGRTIIVDAKVSTRAYIQAIETTVDEERGLLLKRHAEQMRERLTSLSAKNYWEKVAGSADCVVMFVPGENFVAAAFQQDPELFQDSIDRKVLICTPTTFIALAKAISYGWDQERLARNAVQVGQMAKDLYLRLKDMGGHVSVLGTHLKNAAEKYNDMVGNMESRVMPQARKFSDFGVPGTSENIAELAPVTTTVRLPKAGRDLLVPPDSDLGK